MAFNDLYNRLMKLHAELPKPGTVPPAHVDALRQMHLQAHLRNVAAIQQSALNQNLRNHHGKR